MHNMGKTILEPHVMLKLAKKGILKKALEVLAIRQIQIHKPKLQARGKGKGNNESKLAYAPNQKIPPPVKKEHPTKDARLRGSRKLNKGALDLYVGKGNHAAIEAIGRFDLILPSGMVLVLDNCHFSPSITRAVISLSHLWDNGFIQKFMDYGAILLSKG
nr:zinc finger, CCHC-type [Tanacetum cinerariifolium]